MTFLVVWIVKKILTSKKAVFGGLLFLLIGTWVFSEMSNRFSMKGQEPTDEGYIVFHNGTKYFVKGENITASDLENFSDEDVAMFSKKFEEIAILLDDGMKLLGTGIKSGDQVAIWYEEVLESYPAQIKLMQIRKIDKNK